MSELLRRKSAIEATLAKYVGKRFSWSNRLTCIHLARFHARQMGHRPPSIPDFRSVKSARTALAKQGHDSLSALLDSLFPRIAPAEAFPGDLVALRGDEGAFECVCVVVGNGRVLSWHEDAEGAAILQPHEYVAAWRL